MLARWLAIALAIASWSPGLAAQDVEMLGRRYGTRPPAGYYRELARDPEAFQFRRGRAARLREAVARQSLEAQRSLAPAGAAPAPETTASRPALSLGPRSGPVVGEVYIPVILGLFSGSPPPSQARATIQDAYFGTQPAAATVSTYYAEVSSGSITLTGDVREWVRSALSEAETTQGESGLVCCGIGDFIEDLLSRQGSIDWGAYDNDGPDGIPNSGDDDGYVDALAVMHPSYGAECDGSSNRIWSHKWSLSSASSRRTPYTTGTPSANGGFILVDDYFVQGALTCPRQGTGLNPIGVFVHEAGHAFGLPDLYDTRQTSLSHAGAGVWDLMASGTWGCTGNDPSRPCHMGAWSKAMLGWVTVDTLAADTDFGTLTLPPVGTSATVYHVDAADGSDEYFLLENRRDLPSKLFDKNLPGGGGLLIWQVDWGLVLSRWPMNTVNSSAHMGVWLRQADGRDDLGRSGTSARGDGGDPFPGSTSNTQFHAASNPPSRSFLGTATGLSVLDVTPVGHDIDVELSTRFTRVTVDAVGTASDASSLFTVDGASVADAPGNFVLVAPFDTRTIEAAPGESVGPGERRPFDRWTDDAAAPRARPIVALLGDTTLTAAYAGTEYELAIALTGGMNGVTPGSLTTLPVPSDPTSPSLWFPPATDVQVTAVPQTGFAFTAWTGALAGQPNPASVTLGMPVQAGASFQVTYALASAEVDLMATVEQSVQLAVQNGTAPVTWSVLSGVVPQGVSVGSGGLVSGAPLDLGRFPLTVRATDAIGLTATATLTLDVTAPDIPIGELASIFLLQGPQLTDLEATFLDRQGNQNGSYDLGDFRAWVLANPSLPLSADLAALEAEPAAAPRRVVLPVRLKDAPGEEGGR
jgi:M6 family metalloprotease-like protein